MASMIKDIIDLRGILFLMLLTIPSKATNLDCYGKAFHCVNSTHFMICVDLGRGISTTIDDMIIPCPSPTVCKRTNRYECEFLIPSELTPEVSTVVNTQVTESEVATFIPFVTTSIPFEEYYSSLSTNTLPANERNSLTTDSSLAVKPIKMELDTKNVSATETAVTNLILVDVNVKPEPTNVNLVSSIIPSDANGSNVKNGTLNLRIILNDTTSTDKIQQSTKPKLIDIQTEVTTDSPILNIENNNVTTINNVIKEKLTTENVTEKATVVRDVTETILTTEKFMTIFEEPLTEGTVTNYISSATRNPPIATEKIVANDFVQPLLNTTLTILSSAVTEKVAVTNKKKTNNLRESLINATLTDTTTAFNNETITTEQTITNSLMQSSMNSTSVVTTTSTNEPILMTEKLLKEDFQESLINAKQNNFTTNINKDVSATKNIKLDAFISFSTTPSSANTGVETEQTLTKTGVVTKEVIENLESVLKTTVNPIQTVQPIASGSNPVNSIKNEFNATMTVESVANTMLVSNDNSNTFTTQTFLFNTDNNNLNYETSTDIFITESTAVNVSNNQESFEITTTTESAVTTNLVVNERFINESKLQTNKTKNTTASPTDPSVTTKTQTNIYTNDKVLASGLPDVNNNSDYTNHINRTKTTATSENYEELSSVNSTIEAPAVTEPTPYITSKNNLEMVTTIDSVTIATISEKKFSTDNPKILENLESKLTIASKSNTVPEVVKKLETYENASNTTSTFILESTTENIVNTIESDAEKIIIGDFKGFLGNITDKFVMNETVTVVPSNFEIDKTSTKVFDWNSHNKTEIEPLSVSDFVKVNQFTPTPELILLEQIPTIETAKNYKNVLQETANLLLRKTTEQNEPMSTLHTSQPLSSFTINVTDKISTVDDLNQINENDSTALNDNTFVYNEAQTVATKMPPTTIGSATDSLSSLQGQTETAISKQIEIRTSNLRTGIVGENKESFSTQSLLEFSTASPPTEIKIENFGSSTDYISSETTGSIPQITTKKLLLEGIYEYSTTEIPTISNMDSLTTTKHSSTEFVVSNEGQPDENSKFDVNNLMTQYSVTTPLSDSIKLHTLTSHTKIPPRSVLKIQNENLFVTTDTIKYDSDVPTVLFDKLSSLHSKVSSTTDTPVIVSTSNPSINNSATEISNQVFVTNNYFEKQNNPLENVVLNETLKLEVDIQESVAPIKNTSLNMKAPNTRDKIMEVHERTVNKTEKEPNITTTVENAGTNNNDSDLISKTKFFIKSIISENMSNEANQNLSTSLPIDLNKQPTVLTTPDYEGTINTLLEEYDSSKILNFQQERAEFNLNTENTLRTASNTTNKTDILVAIPIIINMPEETKVTSVTSSSVEPVTYSTQMTHQFIPKLNVNKQSISENPTIESQIAIKFNENKLHQTTIDTSLTSNKSLQQEGKDTPLNTSHLQESTTVKSTVGGGSLSVNSRKEDIPNLTKPLRFVVDVNLPLDLVTERDVMANNLNGIYVVSTSTKPTIQAVESSATASVINLLAKASVDPVNTKQQPLKSEAFKTDATKAMNIERYPQVSPIPSVRLESRAKKMETISDANNANQPDKRSVNTNIHVAVASTVTVSSLNTEKNENLGSSQTIFSTSLPDLDITTQQIITGSDVVVNKNMESEKTHSGIISFLTPITKSRETKVEKEKPEDKESNAKVRSEIPIYVDKELATPSATDVFNNNGQKEMSKREEILINTENKNVKSLNSINIEVLSSTKIKTDKNINYSIHTISDGNKNQTPTYTSIKNSRASTNESYKSNSISKDQNNTSYHTDNKTLISNDQSNTSRYKSQINITAASNTQTTAFPALESTKPHIKPNNFSCSHKKRGRYADQKDCKKFYICVGNRHIVEGTCPNNTVFSDIRKQCTKNLSHCIRNNQFRCVTEGRFSDFLNDNVYYICAKNNNRLNSFIRFKLLCQNGYHLNKTSVRCVLNAESSSQQSNSNSDSSKNISEQSGSLTKQDEPEENTEKSIKKFKCKKVGFFPDPTNCRKFYECTKTDTNYRQKKKKCDSGEIFHKDKKKCVDSDSYEC